MIRMKTTPALSAGFLAFALLGAAAPAHAFDPNNPAASGMKLTFDDEFDTYSVSSDAAAAGKAWNDHMWYEAKGTIAANRLSVQNGALRFVGSRTGFGISTMNSSGKGFVQKFGYFEARMWLPTGKGTWPGFWMVSQKRALQGGPAAELDVIEGQGVITNGYFGTLHLDSSYTIGPDQKNPNNWMQAPAGVNLEAGWHRYGALWDPTNNQITFYLDGKAVGSAQKFWDTDGSPMMLILSNYIGDCIGGKNTGTPPPPNQLAVDYVRVFQFPSQSPQAIKAQPVSSPDGGGYLPPGY